MHVDDAAESSSSGFISLMDTPSYSGTPSPPVMSRQASSAQDDDDDDEDLGFGNSKPKKAKHGESDSLKESGKTAVPERPGEQSTTDAT